MGKSVCLLMFLFLMERSSAGTAALGQKCWIHEEDECTLSDSNSECDLINTNTCICSAGYIEEYAVCKVKVDGSTACLSTNECPSNATCAGQCSCDSGYTVASFLCTDVIIGMVCANDADCQNVLSNTECTSLQCACATGFSGSACSSSGAGEFSKTTTIPIATILLTLIYKCFN